MHFGLWAAPTATTVINVLTSGFTHGPGSAVSSAARNVANDSPERPGDVNRINAAPGPSTPEPAGPRARIADIRNSPPIG